MINIYTFKKSKPFSGHEIEHIQANDIAYNLFLLIVTLHIEINSFISFNLQNYVNIVFQYSFSLKPNDSLVVLIIVEITENMH